MQRNRIISIIFGLICTQGIAQQEAQLTQFMYHRLAYNPAYAGASDAPQLSAATRQQWIGFNGAPSTQLLTFDMPFLSKRLGIGLNLNNQIKGLESKQTIGLAWSYALAKTNNWSVRGGLQMSMRRYGMDFKQAFMTTPIAEDYSVGQNFETQWVGNFGGGLYATWHDWYLGIAMPALYQNVIGIIKNAPTPIVATEQRHLFGMGGFSVPLSDKLVAKCNGLFKYAVNSTWTIDANTNFVYDEQLTVGLTYRTGQKTWSRFPESIDILLFMNLNKHLSLGVSYDVVLSPMAAQQKGSLEMSMFYHWKKPILQLSNPRGFF
jgi:type IX secretion system PorP/SprF family membrane protein